MLCQVSPVSCMSSANQRGETYMQIPLHVTIIHSTTLILLIYQLQNNARIIKKIHSSIMLYWIEPAGVIKEAADEGKVRVMFRIKLFVKSPFIPDLFCLDLF